MNEELVGSRSLRRLRPDYFWKDYFIGGTVSPVRRHILSDRLSFCDVIILLFFLILILKKLQTYGKSQGLYNELPHSPHLDLPLFVTLALLFTLLYTI